MKYNIGTILIDYVGTIGIVIGHKKRQGDYSLLVNGSIAHFNYKALENMRNLRVLHEC